MLLGVLLRGVVDVLVEGALDLLCPLIYVIALDVEVIESLAELMITSGREQTMSSGEWGGAPLELELPL